MKFYLIEMKFESFPALVEAINNDKANAKEALEMASLQKFQQHSFLVELDTLWVGSSGGDSKASYQFER